MKIYLASSWDAKARMRTIASRLNRQGHLVTAYWLASTGPGLNKDDIIPNIGKAISGATLDMTGIGEADYVTVFTDLDSTTGGLHVEYGYAMGLNKKTIVVGPVLNIFMVLADYHFENVDQFLEFTSHPAFKGGSVATSKANGTADQAAHTATGERGSV